MGDVNEISITSELHQNSPSEIVEGEVLTLRHLMEKEKEWRALEKEKKEKQERQERKERHRQRVASRNQGAISRGTMEKQLSQGSQDLSGIPGLDLSIEDSPHVSKPRQTDNVGKVQRRSKTTQLGARQLSDPESSSQSRRKNVNRGGSSSSHESGISLEEGQHATHQSFKKSTLRVPPTLVLPHPEEDSSVLSTPTIRSLPGSSSSSRPPPASATSPRPPLSRTSSSSSNKKKTKPPAHSPVDANGHLSDMWGPPGEKRRPPRLRLPSSGESDDDSSTFSQETRGSSGSRHKKSTLSPGSRLAKLQGSGASPRGLRLNVAELARSRRDEADEGGRKEKEERRKEEEEVVGGAGGGSGRVWKVRVKREELRQVKHDEQFSDWKVLVGPGDWGDHMAGKDGAVRYRTHNLPQSYFGPGIYELGIVQEDGVGGGSGRKKKSHVSSCSPSSSPSPSPSSPSVCWSLWGSSRASPTSRRKVGPADVVAVYVGQAENVRQRLQQYGQGGSHLGATGGAAARGRGALAALAAEAEAGVSRREVLVRHAEMMAEATQRHKAKQERRKRRGEEEAAALAAAKAASAASASFPSLPLSGVTDAPSSSSSSASAPASAPGLCVSLKELQGGARETLWEEDELAEEEEEAEGVGLFGVVFERGYSVAFRWAKASSKEAAMEAERLLLETFDYPWNKALNGNRRPESPLRLLEQRTNRNATPGGSRGCFSCFSPPPVMEGVNIKALKPNEGETAGGQRKGGEGRNGRGAGKNGVENGGKAMEGKDLQGINEPGSSTHSKEREGKEGVIKFQLSEKPSPMASNDKSPHQQQQQRQGRRSNSQRLSLEAALVSVEVGENGRNGNIEEVKIEEPKVVMVNDPTMGGQLCGVNLGQGRVCTEEPVSGRKRCATHKGMKVYAQILREVEA